MVCNLITLIRSSKNLTADVTVAHTLVMIYQMIAHNVAVNSYDHALLTLLVSNQFVEIKGSVFKKFEKDNLFQITCAGKPSQACNKHDSDICLRYCRTLHTVSYALHRGPTQPDWIKWSRIWPRRRHCSSKEFWVDPRRKSRVDHFLREFQLFLEISKDVRWKRFD